MKVHCPECRGTFRVEGGERPGMRFDCPFCHAGFSFRDKETVVLSAAPLTQVDVEMEHDSQPGGSGESKNLEVPPDLTDLQVGDVLDGYRLEEVVGWGGMSVVFRARQLSLDRDVAVKLLRKDLIQDPEFSRRFLKEAQALAGLSHPNIVQVIDQGVHQGHHYLVMEFVDGVSLREVLNERRLSPAEALKIVPQLCDALEYAHSKGIIHRDVKPENILIDRQGRPRIADFGLVRLLGGQGPEASRITKTQTVLGTLEYMAPEQREGIRDIDHRADIYSLGVVLYEMLTGELPIARFPLPSERLAVDVRLDQVVLKVLERDRERRYQRASMVATDLKDIDERSRLGIRSPIHDSPAQRFLAMVQSVPFLVFTLFFVMWIVAQRGDDEPTLFGLGVAIPFYLSQLIAFGLLPRPVFLRQHLLYRRPILAGGLLLGIVLALHEAIGGEATSLFSGFVISCALIVAIWRRKVFRQPGEPAFLAPAPPPPSRKPAAPPPPPPPPRAAAVATAVPPPPPSPESSGTQRATDSSPGQSEPTGDAPPSPSSHPIPHLSLLCALGFLLTLATLLYTGALAVLSSLDWKSMILDLPIPYRNTSEILNELWNQPPSFMRNIPSLILLLPFAPLLIPTAVNLLAILPLQSPRRRGHRLLVVSFVLLVAQILVLANVTSTGRHAVDRYGAIVESGRSGGADEGAGDRITSTLESATSARDGLDRMACLHRAALLAGSGPVPHAARAPIVRMALDRNLSSQERKAALVLLERFYGRTLLDPPFTAEEPPGWVERFQRAANRETDRELRHGFRHAIEEGESR